MGTQVSSEVYWVDTCSFTSLARVYPRENFEAVWTLIEALVKAGRLRSVEEVRVELDAQDDDLSVWASHNESLFVPLESDIQVEARMILSRNRTLIDVNTQKGSADPFLIAAARVRGGVVVTEEKHSGGPNKVKIPDVCDVLGVECITLLEVLKRNGLRTRGGDN